VNFFPADIDVAPAFEHLAPAFGAAAFNGDERVSNIVAVIASTPHLRMLTSYFVEME
jgi:thiamine biosynthesis protein ThiC